MTRRLEILLFGCPVCRQHTRHLVFCRYRPAPIGVHPVLLAVLLVAPFWVGVYVVAGWHGVAVMAAVGFFVEVVLFALATREKVRADGPYRPEEVVGELYPTPPPVRRPRRRAPRRPRERTVA